MNKDVRFIMQRDMTEKRTIRNKAFVSLLKTVSYVFTGRLHFNKDHIGELMTTEDGQEYSVFRQVIVDPRQNPPEKPEAILIIRFNFAHGSPKQNKLLSLIPIPFIALGSQVRIAAYAATERN